MSRLTPRSACTSTSPARYVLRRSRMEMIGASIISKRLDSVLSSRFEAGVDRAEQRANNRNCGSDQPPDINDGLDQRAVNHIIDGVARGVREQCSKDRSGDGQ